MSRAAAIPGVDAEPRGRVTEAAPARRRIAVVAGTLAIAFLGLAARATQLAFAGDPLADARGRGEAAAPMRADLLDRNGAILATTLPSFTLVAEPANVWDAPSVARKLAALFPDLDAATVERRLSQKNLSVVYLKRNVSPKQRDAVFEQGLAGVSFRDDSTRVYPQGDLAAHLVGGVSSENKGYAGVESGLDAEILRAGALGKPVRLSVDIRVQHALEAELDRSIKASSAEGAAGIILDGKTGEVLAMASLPSFNPNDPPAPDSDVRLNRAARAVYEMGSSLKPFTVAMGLEAGVTTPDEIFDLSKPLPVGDIVVQDYKGLGRPASLAESFADSSNIMAATIALRVGAERQRAALRELGLYDRAVLQLPETARPILPRQDNAVTTAVLGYGHGMAMSLAALADAYTVFANDGARVQTTLLARESGDAPAKTKVFEPKTARTVLALMRRVVTDGTGRRADVPGLEIAGKTGSAEKPNDKGVYVPDSLFSSFAAVFPASKPQYVIVVALDQPKATAESGNLATGGAVAAPTVGRIAARMAPLMNVTPKRGVE